MASNSPTRAPRARCSPYQIVVDAASDELLPATFRPPINPETAAGAIPATQASAHPQRSLMVPVAVDHEQSDAGMAAALDRSDSVLPPVPLGRAELPGEETQSQSSPCSGHCALVFGDGGGLTPPPRIRKGSGRPSISATLSPTANCRASHASVSASESERPARSGLLSTAKSLLSLFSRQPSSSGHRRNSPSPSCVDDLNTSLSMNPSPNGEWRHGYRHANRGIRLNRQLGMADEAIVSSKHSAKVWQRPLLRDHIALDGHTILTAAVSPGSVAVLFVNSEQTQSGLVIYYDSVFLLERSRVMLLCPDLHTFPLVALGKAAFANSGQLLAIECGGKQGSHALVIYEMVTGLPIIRYDHENLVRSMAWSPRDDMLALGNDQGGACLLHFQDDVFCEEFIDLKHTDDVVALKFSPDGLFLASGSKDKSLRVYSRIKDSSVYDPALMCQLGLDRIYAIDFSHKGDYILAGSDDHKSRIFRFCPFPESSLQEEPLVLHSQLPAHEDYVRAAVFSQSRGFRGGFLVFCP